MVHDRAPITANTPQGERPAWADPYVWRASGATLRTPITVGLLEQAIRDEDLVCVRSRTDGELATFWIATPDGALQLTDSSERVPDSAWQVQWSVRRDAVLCTSTAGCGSALSRLIARTVADRWNSGSESCHRIAFLPDGDTVVTRAAVPLPNGVTVADLRALVRMLLSTLTPFHVAVLRGLERASGVGTTDDER